MRDLEAPGSCRSARVRKHGGVHCLQQVACEQPCGALRGYPAHESALMITHNLQACVATTPHLSLLGRTIPQHSVRSQLPPTSCCECLLTSCHVPLQIRPPAVCNRLRLLNNKFGSQSNDVCVLCFAQKNPSIVSKGA